MIIGLTGLIGAGKGTVAEYLKKKNFVYYSLSDEIRQEAEARGIEKNLTNLINLGNKLRKEFGAGILAQRINEKIKAKQNQNYVVDSIRNPEEIKELKKNFNFYLISVVALIEKRYQRVHSRKRENEEKISFEEFKKKEKGQLAGAKTGQQLQKCMEQANFQIDNNQTIKDLEQKIEEVLTKINES